MGILGIQGAARKQDVLFVGYESKEGSPPVRGEQSDSCVGYRKDQKKLLGKQKGGVRERPKQREGRLLSTNARTRQRMAECHLVPNCPHVSAGAVPSSPDSPVSPTRPLSTISFGEWAAAKRDVAQMEKEDAPSAGSFSKSTTPFGGDCASMRTR